MLSVVRMGENFGLCVAKILRFSLILLGAQALHFLSVTAQPDTSSVFINRVSGAISVVVNNDTCRSCVQNNDIFVPPSVVIVNVQSAMTALYDYRFAAEAETPASRQFNPQPVISSTFGPYYRNSISRAADSGAFRYPRQDSLDTFQLRIDNLDSLLADTSNAGELVVERDSLQRIVRRLKAQREEFERLIQTHDILQNLQRAIDNDLYGQGGLMHLRLEALHALQSLVETNSLGRIVANLRNQIGDPFRDRTLTLIASLQKHMRQTRTTLASRTQLESRLDSLIGMLSTLKQYQLRNSRERSFRMVNDFEGMNLLAYDTERLLLALFSAADTWQGQLPAELSFKAGREIVLSIGARSNIHLARLAVKNNVEYKIHILSDAVIRPSLGLSVVFAPTAEFGDFGLQPANGGFEIVESQKVQDSRFTWGFTIGLTYSILDWRQENGIAVWLPELSINPSDEVNAIGLGAGVSFLQFLKVGIGAIWTKHSVLELNKVGDIINDAAELRVRDSFGSPNVYFSISVFAWPDGL